MEVPKSITRKNKEGEKTLADLNSAHCPQNVN